MRDPKRPPRRFPWRGFALVAVILAPFAVRYTLIRYRLERKIEATEREQRDWIARDRAEGEAMKQWMEDAREDVLRRRGLSTRPTTVPSADPEAQPAVIPPTAEGEPRTGNESATD